MCQWLHILVAFGLMLCDKVLEVCDNRSVERFHLAVCLKVRGGFHQLSVQAIAHFCKEIFYEVLCIGGHYVC